MANKPFFAYLMHLSTHMWMDENSTSALWYPTNLYCENNNVDIDVWDETVRFLAEKKFDMVLIDVGDGIKYESHPEISAPDAWDKDFIKMKLDEIRALGIEPVPKLNFSAGHDTWMKKYRRMVSTPAYYKMCSEIIAEVCEIFGYPRLFHLGLDEETAPIQANYECVIIRNRDLWWHDAYFLFAECEKHGARPWVWSDYMWDHPDIFFDKMPRSVVQSNWYYSEFRDFSADMPRVKMKIECYEKLDKLGYDQVPTCSTVYKALSPHNTLAFCKEKLSDEHLLGIMTAPWYMTDDDSRYALLNDAHRFYKARKRWYPETL